MPLHDRRRQQARRPSRRQPPPDRRLLPFLARQQARPLLPPSRPAAAVARLAALPVARHGSLVPIHGGRRPSHLTR
ncbi:hypothetical protein NL676_033610 [Syzygium grande]|nr:hypothetical protein NL676_033610 [Syzygium grande]